MDQGKILVVEDEESLRRVLKKALEEEGYWVEAADSGAVAREALRQNHFDVSLLDIRLPDVDGLTLLKEAHAEGISTLLIVMTAQSTMNNAIEAMKNGAFDYVTKPFDLEEILVTVKRAFESRQLNRQFQELKQEVRKRFEPGLNMIGASSAMQKVYKTIGQVVNSDATILIHGESGTGKELVAKTIHYNSPRWNKPFIALNCAAIPTELLESELFGHEKGSFTGALERRVGKFELAEEGTLFLDEVGDIPLALQTKLLRVLQEREYGRVGGKDMLKANVRIVAATNQDLDKAVREKRFREDLYHGLAVIIVDVPPLRDRVDDIPQLIQHFCNEICKDYGIPERIFDAKAIKKLQSLPWTGNIRELKNVVERLIILGGKTITDKDIEKFVLPTAQTTLEMREVLSRFTDIKDLQRYIEQEFANYQSSID